MSRPARKLTAAHQPSGVASAAPAALPLDEVSVVCLTECILNGIRRRPGERFTLPAEQASRFTALGHILPDAFFDFLQPEAVAAWRAMGTRTGLTAASLVCDDATAEALWAAEGRILTPEGVPSRYQPHPVTGRPLRVLQLTQYDPGSSVYRYHSAANTVPGIVSALVRYGYSNPHCHLRQWDGELHRRTVELLAMTADVIHCHMDYRALHQDLKFALLANQRAAITYHGSVVPGDTRRTFVDTEADRRMNAIRFGARPYHARWGVEQYLPIPVPVADYTALVQRPTGGPFRIAHSPTKREIKGTADFLAAVAYLKDAEGLPVEAVLIENMDHGEALRLKARCHATFDSFWLGMQGSGLEAAAMGQPVIAGDPEAAADAAALNDDIIPWTYANDRYTLMDVIRRLVTAPNFAAAEARRVGTYVLRMHDYPVVGARYRDILTEAIRGAADRI